MLRGFIDPEILQSDSSRAAIYQEITSLLPQGIPLYPHRPGLSRQRCLDDPPATPYRFFALDWEALEEHRLAIFELIAAGASAPEREELQSRIDRGEYAFVIEACDFIAVDTTP